MSSRDRARKRDAARLRDASANAVAALLKDPTRCRIEWTLHDGNRIKIGAEVDWSDPLVRVDVREDARLIAQAVGTVEIVSQAGEVLDVVRWPR